MNERHGIISEYAGVDHDSSTFVWLRSFDDEESRVATKAAFYGSSWWLEREEFAMAHITEYSVEFLDAAFVNRAGSFRIAEFEGGEVAGSGADSPPNGWVASPARRFVPRRGA